MEQRSRLLVRLYLSQAGVIFCGQLWRPDRRPSLRRDRLDCGADVWKVPLKLPPLHFGHGLKTVGNFLWPRLGCLTDVDCEAWNIFVGDSNQQHQEMRLIPEI